MEYADNIPDSDLDPCHYINVSSPFSFFLEPVSAEEVGTVIKNLKNTKQDLNTISVATLKDNYDKLAPIFADLINLCFQSGTFPNILKIAIVLPLFKKGDPEVLSNYRPISILPTISKIIEKCIKSRLMRFFLENNLLNEVRFGFQNGLSTQDAIIHLTEKIYSNLNNKLSTIAAYIDFSKCFDTLNRGILIKKLEAYGVRGIPLSLFKSYLKDRYQAVKMNGVVSEYKLINTGVPQGSVLGPILYLIYVNELPKITSLFDPSLFADDTTLIFESSDKNILVNNCNLGLNLFFSWCCANKLSINIAKTNIMLFSNNLCPNDISEVYMNNLKIDYASSVRFLGIIVDDQLKFDQHINLTANKISKNIGILYKLRQYVPRNTLTCMYRNFVECYLNYCNIIFGNAYPSHIKPLEIVQKKKCLRSIDNQPPLFHAFPIFSEPKVADFI